MIFNPRKVPLLLVLFFSIGNCYAQLSMPNVVLPSPQAREFHKYGDYPVSHYTGIPGISIPLYEIKSGDLVLPLTMRYHAAGFKPSDKEGALGLYWSLNIGGMISRQVRGLADDDRNGYGLLRKVPKTVNQLYGMSRMDVYDYLAEVMHEMRDTEYDIFSYSAGGNSGSFALKGTYTGGVLRADAILSNDRKKERINTNFGSNYTIESFDVTNEDGVRYHFGKSLVDGVKAAEESGNRIGVSSTSTWLLTDMISADLTDTISFIYSDFIYQSYTLPNYVTSLIKGHDYFNYCTDSRGYTSIVASTSVASPDHYHYTKLIEEIRFKGGVLKFNYSLEKKIQSIQVKNYLGTVVQTINFSHSRFDPNTPYLHTKLDQVSLNGDTETYGFEYNIAPLSTGELSEDWWGFYNGTYFPSAMTPGMQDPKTGFLFGYSNVTREANAHMSNYILKKITYPTGGATTFDFEVNQYLSGGVIKPAGGLRIARIINDNGAGSVSTKQYRYGENESGAGRLVAEPVWDNLVSYRRDYDWGSLQYWNTCTRTLMNSFFMDWSASGSDVISNYVPSQTNYSSAVYYKEVAEYMGSQYSNELNAGKTVYKFKDAQFSIYASPGEYGYYEQPVRQLTMPAAEETIYPAIEYGLPDETITFKRGIDSFQRVKREYFEHDGLTFGDLQSVRVYKYTYNRKNVQAGAGGDPNWERDVVLQHPNYPFPIGFPVPVPPPYLYDSYHILHKSIYLKAKVTEIFSSGLTTVEREDYRYNENGILAGVERKGSNDRLYVRSSIFPNDLSSTPLSAEDREAVDTMVRRNMAGVPLHENRTVIDRNLEYMVQAAEDKETKYKLWGGKMVVRPKEVVIRRNGVGGEKIFYLRYDAEGNILESQKENDQVVSYLWDYKQQYPVAEVKNAAWVDIAYTSFEAESKGGWIFGGVSENGSDAPTGSRVYNIAGGSLMKYGLNASMQYVIAYWKKGGPLTISGESGTVVTGSTENGWTYFEHLIKNVEATTLSGSGLIDEVRLFPVNAQMLTHTFTPLVGMTSSCDMNGKVTYYEYDAYNRLRQVKDMQRKILKVIDYQFDAQN